jgi:exonuclease SbcD
MDMKIFHTSDWHVDEHNHFQDTLRILEWLCDEARAQSPDAIFVCGDSAPVSVRPMTPLERNTLADVYVRLAEHAPVFVVRGNHDIADRDIDIFGRLKSRHSILAFSNPGIARGSTRGGQPFVVAALPYPSKGFLMARAKTDGVRLDDVNAACREAIKAVLMGLKVEMESDPKTTVRLILAHINVSGALAGGFALIGQDVEAGALELESTGADYIACGHIHKVQQMSARVWYPGSPRRVDFGEEGEEKGYLLVTVEPGQEPVVEFRPSPLRKMQTIRVTVGENGIETSGPIEAGADARVIIDVDEQRRSSIDMGALLDTLHADGAHAVKTEFRVTPNQRVRAPEMQAATTDADRLRAFLGTLDVPVEPWQMDRLLMKLGQISGGAA